MAAPTRANNGQFTREPSSDSLTNTVSALMDEAVDAEAKGGPSGIIRHYVNYVAGLNYPNPER